MQCRRCEKLTSELENGYCSECQQKNRTDLKIIRDYIETHRGANAMDISLETGIPLRVINRLLKEDSLYIAD